MAHPFATKAMVEKLEKINKALHSKRGRNALTFLAFLVLSTVLWIVLSLNEEAQRDIRCTVRITNVPDSVTRITPLPEAINVSVRSRGTELMKYWWSNTPQISLDYKLYKKGNKIQFGESAMRAFFRSLVGSGNSQILAVSPDTLTIEFTNNRGIPLPVRLDSKITAAQQYVIVGKPQILHDTVTLYSNNPAVARLRSLETERLNLTDLRKPGIFRVPVVTPANSRAIPDSVDVKVTVEPLISKSRMVQVRTINVPEGKNMIIVPSQIEVYYMVPMSIYKKIDSDPRFTIVANYRSIHSSNGEKIPVELVNSPKDFTNLYLSTDSVDFIIEEK